MSPDGARQPFRQPASQPGVPSSGVFIAFEGGEGSGKSTQIQLLAAAVEATGRVCTVTREPGGSVRAERIRAILLDDGSQDMDPRSEALLFAAARADHAHHLIRPALRRGEVVLSDRYLDSSVAYQGVARGLGSEWIRGLSLWATEDLRPDLTVVLDIDPGVGLARAQHANRLEAESLDFHHCVRRAFLDFAAADPKTHVVVSAEQSVEYVHNDIWRAVSPLVVAP